MLLKDVPDDVVVHLEISVHQDVPERDDPFDVTKACSEGWIFLNETTHRLPYDQQLPLSMPDRSNASFP